MDGTYEARVVRADDVEELDGVIEILDFEPDEALLPVPAPAGAVARRAVPGGGRDDLVIGNLAVPDPDPVPEAAPRGVDSAEAVALGARLGGDVRWLVEVLAQLCDRRAHDLQGRHWTVQARELPQPRAGSLSSEQRARERVAAEDEVGQRAELHHVVVVACRL